MSIAQSNPAEAAERMELEGQPDGNEIAVAQYKNAVKKVGGSIKQSMTRGCGYQKHQLHLSVTQQRKLAAGHKVRVKHGHLGFDDSDLQTVPVHLTMAQLRKIQRAHAGNRGVDVQFSSGQQRMMHGKGFFGDLWKGVKNVGRRAVEIARPFVTDVGRRAIEHAVPRATNFASNLLENRILPALSARADLAAQRLGDRVESGVNRGLDLVNQGVSRVGLGMAGRGRGRIVKRRGGAPFSTGRGMRGDGFFDDVWSGIKSVGRTALPIATNLVVNRALAPLKAMTGGRGGRRRGGAPFATGRRQ